MCEVERLGIPMCRPIDFGETDEFVYSIQTWIHGADAEEVIVSFSDDRQYAFGLTAGRILKKIHSIPAPPDQPDWEPRFNAKIDRKIKMYADCPIHFEGDDHLLRYIEENRHLLRDRPQTFQHGDYHIGNMMLVDMEILTHPVVVFNLLFLGIVASMLCFIAWNAAVKVLGPSRTANYIYFQPMSTLVLSSIILSEVITLTSLIGAICIIGGVYLAEKE